MSLIRRSSGIIAGILAAILVSRGAMAAPPKLTSVFPSAANVGETTSVELIGAFDPWPVRVWCSNPKLTFAPGKEKPLCEITIAEDAEPGPCFLRVWNEEGASEVVHFIIGKKGTQTHRENQKENNNSVSTAESIATPLPIAIHGRLNPAADVDCYRVTLKKGQTLFALLEAYTLKGGVDSLLHLYAPNGDRVQIAHDSPTSLDPQLKYIVESDGDHVIAVMGFATPPKADVKFYGGVNCNYRLNVGTSTEHIPARLLPFTGGPDGDISKPLTPPFDFFGTLSKSKEQDTVIVSAKAKEKLYIQIKAFEHRYPTDPFFILQKPDGSELRKVDDVKPNSDGNYLWSVSADGDYPIVIGDRFQKGGPEFRYQIKVAPPIPSITATADKSAYLIEPEKSVDLKIKVTRLLGHALGLKLQIEGLPEGVSANEPEVPKKSGEVVVKLTATKEAKASSRPLKISLIESEGYNPVTYPAVFSLQDANARGPYLLDETSDLWLTVKAPAKKKG